MKTDSPGGTHKRSWLPQENIKARRYNIIMKEHYTKQLKRGSLIKLSDGSMAVIRDNEPSVKRKVEAVIEGKPQLIQIESYCIVSVNIKGQGWLPITHTDKEKERQASHT